MNLRPYDAILVVSFGGPEGPEDVMPFLENVTAGRGIPRERLAAVAEHYDAFGGRSPINDLNRELISAVTKDLSSHGSDLPVYWGNRNWDPYLRDTVSQMVDDGVERAICFITSTFSSYSGCRQYRENLFEASEGLPIQLDRLRHAFNHPNFVASQVRALERSLAEVGPAAHVLFVTHSIPLTMNEASGGPGAGLYEKQHFAVAELVASRAGAEEWDLVYCSRSGSPHQPWLEPDVNDRITELAAEGCEAVVLVPIGFISDHMEVIHDLDTEARETASDLGVRFARADTAGTDPEFITMIRELIVERAAAERGESPERPSCTAMGPRPDTCQPDCCVNPARDLPVVP